MHIIIFTNDSTIQNSLAEVQENSFHNISHQHEIDSLHITDQALFIIGPDIPETLDPESFAGFIRKALFRQWQVLGFCYSLHDGIPEKYFEYGCDDVLQWSNDPTYLKNSQASLIKRFQCNNNTLRYLDARVLSNVNIVPWEFDVRNWRFNYMGNNISNILGYPAENWLGTSYNFKLVHPDDLQSVKDFYRSCLQLNGEVRDIRYRMLAAGGKVVRVRNLVWVNQYAQESNAIVTGLLMDVNSENSDMEKSLLAREQLLSEFKQHLDMAPIALLQADENLNVTSWSRGAEEMFGIFREQALGKPWRDLKLIHEADSQRVIEELLPLLKGDAQYMEIHNRNITADGSTIHVHWVNSCLRNADGSLHSLLSMGRDISSEVESLEKTRELDKMNAMVTLSTGIAHDFNNLLTPILISAELIGINENATTDITELASTVRSHALKARDIIKFMTDLSKPLTVNWQSIKVESFVSDLQKIFDDILTPNVSLEIHTQPSLTCFMGDESLLYDALINLIKNAFHSYGDTPGTINLSFRCTGDKVKVLEMLVEDKGTGISKQNQAEIFTPFFSTKNSNKGTGLGLVMARKTAEAHGGNINFDSTEGLGTLFRITIPYLEINPSVQEITTDS